MGGWRYLLSCECCFLAIFLDMACDKAVQIGQLQDSLNLLSAARYTLYVTMLHYLFVKHTCKGSG